MPGTAPHATTLSRWPHLGCMALPRMQLHRLGKWPPLGVHGTAPLCLRAALAGGRRLRHSTMELRHALCSHRSPLGYHRMNVDQANMGQHPSSKHHCPMPGWLLLGCVVRALPCARHGAAAPYGDASGAHWTGGPGVSYEQCGPVKHGPAHWGQPGVVLLAIMSCYTCGLCSMTF